MTALQPEASNILQGIYMGPYTIDIVRDVDQAICDDYMTETYFGPNAGLLTLLLLAGLVARPLGRRSTMAKRTGLTKYKQSGVVESQLLKPAPACAPGNQRRQLRGQ